MRCKPNTCGIICLYHTDSALVPFSYHQSTYPVLLLLAIANALAWVTGSSRISRSQAIPDDVFALRCSGIAKRQRHELRIPGCIDFGLPGLIGCRRFRWLSC